MKDLNLSTKAFEMHQVCVNFGNTRALNGVSFAVAAGELRALIGQNGAGKSTLMGVLSGALQADSGTMLINGLNYQPRSPLEARVKGIAMIHQEPALVPDRSVEENIFLGMEPTKHRLLDRQQMRQRAQEALAELGVNLDVSRRTGDLSISERQLIAIARASAVGCRILILDEPTSRLSAADRPRLFALLERLKSKGYAIVYISHFLEEIQKVADTFTVLRDGQVAGEGQVATTPLDQLVRLMIGKELSDLYVRSEHTSGQCVLEIDRLSSDSGLESATLSLHSGEVLGIFGLVGSGRTELVRTIFGLDKVRSGTIKVGAYQGPASPSRRWSQGIGMVSEDRKQDGLAMSMTIAENVILSRPQAAERFGILRPGLIREIGKRWIDAFTIRSQGPDQEVGELSGGNQQKVAIARLLQHGVTILLLDEPTQGIDIGSKHDIYKLIDAEARKGKAILLVSSYLPELLGVSDRIAVMHRGRLLPPRPVHEVTADDIMRQATGVRGDR